MRLPPLGALRAFEVAARLLSLSRAGDELHVTHAAVSHQIRNLEDWFGFPLFQRDGRGIRLTASGQALFDRVSPLFESMADACKIVDAMSGASTLTVGCVPSIAARWLVPNLVEFTERNPQIDIRVVYAKSNEQLNADDLDILITTAEDESRYVISERLFSRVNKPVCSPSFLAQYGPFESPKQIVAAPLLHDETREGWHDWCEAAGVKDTKALSGPIYQDFNMLATAVLAGHGLALCPINVFRAEIGRGDLVVLSEVGINENRGYFILTRDDRTIVVDEFVKWFVAIAQEGCVV